MSEVFHLTNESFDQEVLMSDIPVLVDFWAPWCGPCRGMMPYVEAIAKETEEWAVVCKLEANDDSNELVNSLGVMGLPTFLIYKDGKLENTIVGAVPKSVLIDAMEKVK